MSSRRARRRRERERAKRPVRTAQTLSAAARGAMVVSGVLLFAAGIFLLAHPVSRSSRFERLAGLAMVIGVALAAAGIFGRSLGARASR